MTTVIGLAPNERGAAAVHLGSMLARSMSDDVVVATVVPTPWPPNPYHLDDEYLALQERAAEEALAEARTQISDDLTVTLVTHHATSVALGLLEVAQQYDATLVALGSSARGVLGLVSLGGVADRILHSSHIPCHPGPEGFQHRKRQRPRLPDHGGVRPRGPRQRPAAGRQLSGQGHRGVAPGRLLRRPATE